VLLALFSGVVFAASEEIRYAGPPDWVVRVPEPTESESPAGAPIRVEHLDFQIHTGLNGEEIFNAWRVRILKPEGLAAGNVTLAWYPDAGDATVHYLRILRDGKLIDVLQSTKFEVLRREGSLETAMLNGQLTAALQVPGLQVGDALELAATIRRKDPTLGDHSFGFVQLPAAGLPGAYRARVLWPETRKLVWRASSDVPPLKETRAGGNKEIVFDLRDPHAVIVANGAPARVNLRRLIEYSDFSSWREVSARVWPLFETASELPRDSPLREEIARIAASTKDPVQRAEAALRLVQDRIRYVYVGLNGGNMLPATIAETWSRRFGDCKAKTVLLMAMLRELGISAEPQLVHSLGGDGADERLPSPGMFDHVLVRADVGGATYFLDGTRIGDRSLSALPTPIYRWALPLRPGGADLESVAPVVPHVPLSITVIDMDARGGFEERGPVKGHLILRGQEAIAIRTELSAMAAPDAERAIRAYWDRLNSWMEADTASWRFDEQQAALQMSVAGTGKLMWDGDQERGRSMDIPGAGFTPPAEYRRPKEQDQTAPWVTEYPAYRCWATAIRLPVSESQWQWEYRANPVSLRMGGVTYWRASDMRDGVVRTVMSKRFDVPEISAAEAQDVNRMLPSFNNKISQVYQIRAGQTPAVHVSWPPTFKDDTDWLSGSTPCGEQSDK
jgi:transglutaminase-like putative cysteine protease